MAGKVLELEFKAKDGATAALKQMGLSADQTARKMREIEAASKQASGGKSDGGKGLFSAVDDGAKSAAKELGSSRALKKLLKGGLVGFAGKELAESTEQGVEIANSFRDGKVNAAGLTQSLLQALPIVGSFATAGKNIREIITGEQHEIDKVKHATEQQTQIIEYQTSLYEQQKKRLIEIGNAIRDISNRRANVGVEGFALGQNQQSQAAQKRLDDLGQKRQAELDANDKERKRQLEELSTKQADGSIDKDAYRKNVSLINSSAKRNAADINAKYGDVERRERETSAAELSDWQRKQNEASEKLVRGHEAELTAIVAKAREDRLRVLGLAGNAELDQIAASADAKKKAIQQQYDEERKTVAPALAANLESQKNRRLKAVDDEAEAARANLKYQTGETFKQEQRQQRQQLLDLRVEDAGTPGERLRAKRAAEAERLRDEFAERQKQLRQQLLDPNLSAAQKQQATQGLQDWAAESARQLDRRALGAAPIVSHLADLTESHTLSGLSAEGRERRTDDPINRVVKSNDEAVKLQKTMADGISRLVQAVEQGQQTGQTPLSVFDW